MFDTYVTVVGNVLTAPAWRRTEKTKTLVANFKVASTARRLDRENNRWVDGNSLRVRVNCWRKLAEGVAASVTVGDPIVVVGRLYTRDWIDSDGNHRALYEMEAVAVGHDLARGRGRFARNKPTLGTSTVEDAEAESRVHGEVTEPVPDAEAPARLGELFDDDPDPTFAESPVPPMSGYDEVTALRGGGFEPAPAGEPTDDELGPLPDEEVDLPEEPSSGGDASDELDDPADDPRPAGSRSRRTRTRAGVPA
jgi:single-strand DNA-binding protein